MDLTYKPYLRDNELEVDYSIPSPIYTVPYKLKYTVAEEEPEETSIPVEVELPSPQPKRETYTTPKRSSKSTRIFSSKEEFSSTMTPIYEKLLKQKGLNPAFAKALVAQDGLESAWGRKPSGTFNFGGIKGKGTIKNTREVINGKDLRLNQEFRDFSSLEDYANYKINLLNNKRYNAFSGSINDFASRVAKGGYATDPNYRNVLHNLISKSKLGGVLRKLQDGGKVKDRWTDREDIESTQEWLTNWYSKRKPIINKNLWDRSWLPKWMQNKEIGFNWLNDRLTSVDTYLYNSGPEEQEDYRKAVNGPIGRLLNIDVSDQIMQNREGVYNPTDHYLVVRADSKTPVDQIAAHELTHSTNPYFVIETIKEYEKRRPIHESNAYPDEYLDRLEEIYSRLMEFRKAHNIDPTHVFTKEEVENFRNKQTEKTQYGFTFKNKHTGEEIPQLLNRAGDIKSPKPYTDWDIKDAREFRQYKLDGDPDLFNRYNDDFILFLLNDIAKAPQKSFKIKSAKSGGHVPKFQDPAGPLQSYEDFTIVIPTYQPPTFSSIDSTSLTSYEPPVKKWDTDTIKAFLKEVEGYLPEIKEDVNGNATVGYGHKLTAEEKVKWKNKVFTRQELEDIFEEDFNTAKNSVNKYYDHLSLKDNELAALISIAFNGGERLIRARRDANGNKLPNTPGKLVYSPKFEKAMNDWNENRTTENLNKVIEEMQYVDDIKDGQARRYGITRALMEGKIRPEHLGTLMTNSADSLIGYRSNKKFD